MPHSLLRCLLHLAQHANPFIPVSEHPVLYQSMLNIISLSEHDAFRCRSVGASLRTTFNVCFAKDNMFCFLPRDHANQLGELMGSKS